MFKTLKFFINIINFEVKTSFELRLVQNMNAGPNGSMGQLRPTDGWMTLRLVTDLECGLHGIHLYTGIMEKK